MTTNVIVQGDCRETIPQWFGTEGTMPKIDCIVADPPYGVAFTSFKAETPAGKKYTDKIAHDDSFEIAIPLFLDAMEALRPFCAEQCELYVFTKWDIIDTWMPVVRDLPDFKLMMMGVWEKGYPGLGDLDGNWGCGHELILYAKKGRRPAPFRKSFILHVDKLGPAQHIHPTEKPVPLVERLLEFSTSPGSLVVDPFSGSGSTAVAAQNLGRNSVGFEIEERYVTASRQRLQQVGFDFPE